MQGCSITTIKNLLAATAVAGAFAAPACAQTGITVSGLVDVYAGSLKNPGGERRGVVNSGGLTTSWFGFKGSEDLGGGLKANFLLTSFIQADTGVQGRGFPDTLFSRDAAVGLSGSFGAISLGRELAPHFLPTILFNPFGDSYSFSPLILHADVPVFNGGSQAWTGSLAGDTGWSNSLRYTTPKFGGLSANLHYQFGEAAGDSGVNNVGANALYFNGPLSLTAFYHRVEVSNPLSGGTIAHAGAARQSAWMIGGGYDFKIVKLYATYGRTSHDIAIDDKTVSLGATLPYGQGKFQAAWAQTRREGSALTDDVRRNTATVGYDYDLSKRTDLYALYMHDRITGLSNGNSIGLGVRHRF